MLFEHNTDGPGSSWTTYWMICAQSRPRPAGQILSLGLHELATNAVKHGALRNGKGSINISREQKDSGAQRPVVRLRWVEHCVREHMASTTKVGFGRFLIEKVIPQQLGGSTEFSLRSNGLDCVIELPLA